MSEQVIEVQFDVVGFRCSRCGIEVHGDITNKMLAKHVTHKQNVDLLCHTSRFGPGTPNVWISFIQSDETQQRAGA